MPANREKCPTQMSESLRDLRLFVASYEERSFTAAAERENATQPGVSQHIRKIEDRLGVTLFTRTPGAVIPTPAGDTFYHRCIDVLRAYEAATRSAKEFAGSLEDSFSVGLMPTLTRRVLAPALARFTEEHPNAAIRIIEAYSPALTLQVRSGELAFAIVPALAGAVGLRSRSFLRTPEVLVTSVNSALVHMEPVTLAELAPLKIIVPSLQNTRHLRILTYLASNDVRPDRVMELDAMLGTLGLVATSNWAAILPGIMMEADELTEPRAFCANPLSAPSFALDLVLIEPSRCAMPPAAEAFLNILVEEALRLNRGWEPFLST